MPHICWAAIIEDMAELTDLNKTKLLELAAKWDVPADPGETKRVIADRIEEYGYSYEDAFWSDKEEDRPGDPAEEAPAEEEPGAVAEEEQVEEPEKPKDEGPLAVRFIGKNRSHSVGRTTFTAAKPFKIFEDAEEARAFVRRSPKKFRLAAPEEVEAFYRRG